MSLNAFPKLGGIVAFAVLLASCATTPSETTEQPDLAALAQPYTARLLAAGVSRIEVPNTADGARFVSVETPYGYFYIRYPENLPRAPFLLTARDNTAFVRSDTYAPGQLAQYQEAIDWVVPEVLRAAPRNEAELRLVQQGSGR
jgi:hypothetical protein